MSILDRIYNYVSGKLVKTIGYQTIFGSGNIAGGGGGEAVWGSIEGNMQSQTDLMTALDDKANKTDVYTKAQANTLLDAKANASDVYNKTQTDNLLDAKQGVLTAGAGITITNDTIAVSIINDTLASRTTVWSSQEVKDRFDAISGSARIVVVASLPASPEDNTLYYVGSASPYHIWLQSAGVLYDMGTTEIDLSGYYNKTEIDALLLLKQNAITDNVQVATPTDADYLSDLSGTTNKRWTFAKIWDYIQNKIALANYPIGSIYQTINENFNPATTWGGTWSLISSGNYLVACGSGEIGGDSVAEQLPNIKGEVYWRNRSQDTDGGCPRIENGYSSGALLPSSHKGTRYLQNVNSAISTSLTYPDGISIDAHSSNPIYVDNGHVIPNSIKVFMWQRTA